MAADVGKAEAHLTRCMLDSEAHVGAGCQWHISPRRRCDLPHAWIAQEPRPLGNSHPQALEDRGFSNDLRGVGKPAVVARDSQSLFKGHIQLQFGLTSDFADVSLQAW